jgi:hypothetical protein
MHMDVDTLMPAWPLLSGHATKSDGLWPHGNALTDAQCLGISALISLVQSDPRTRSGRVQVRGDTRH